MKTTLPAAYLPMLQSYICYAETKITAAPNDKADHSLHVVLTG